MYKWVRLLHIDGVDSFRTFICPVIFRATFEALSCFVLFTRRTSVAKRLSFLSFSRKVIVAFCLACFLFLEALFFGVAFDLTKAASWAFSTF